MDDSILIAEHDPSMTDTILHDKSVAAILLSKPRGNGNNPMTSSSSASVVHVNLCVHSQRKRRGGLEDPIQFSMQSFEFDDDTNRFSHLDGALCRFLPGLESVHLAIVDSNLLANGGGDKLAKTVKDVIQANLSSSTELSEENANEVVRVVTNVKKLAGEMVDEWVKILLVEDSSQHLAYRGSRHFHTQDSQSLTKRTLGLLIQEEELLSQGIEGKVEILTASLDSHLAMDRTAAESISLMPPPNNNAPNNSIYSVLNKCSTKMGERLLQQWLRQPLVDLDEIVSRHDAVEFLCENTISRDQIRNSALRGCSDLDRLSARLMKGGKLPHLYELYIYASSQLPLILDTLRDAVSETDSELGKTKLQKYVADLEEVNQNLTQLKNLVETVMDLDVAPREYLIKAEFDPDLADLRSDLDQIEIDLDRLHQEIDYEWSEISGQSSGSVRLENIADKENFDGCWQFRLPKQNDLKTVDEHWTNSGRVKVHRVLKNGVYFSTKELRDLGIQKLDILQTYTERQKKVVDDAMEVAKTYCPVLEKASLIISEIDVLCSFSFVASHNPQGYCRPIMTDGVEDGVHGVKLTGARHPCVELQEGVEFIPNSYNMVFGESSFHIITGPNMGGKSTYIRALGAIITMAQVGSFVPCNTAELNIFHSLLARVGAGDAQQRGISTFMAEMLEASSILQSASKRSLIIIDELGRGTSTFDGFGLAWSISEYIVQRIGCVSVFATHFHELTALEEQETCVKNCHVSAHRPTDGSSELTFLYEVRPGPCLESFGIAVAEMANCPKSMIANAKRKAKELECFDYKNKKLKGSDDALEKHRVIESFKALPMALLVTPDQKLNAVKKCISQLGN